MKILLAWFVLHTVVSAIFGIIPPGDRADVAVVLGNKINPDGEPHPRTAARLDRAIELWREDVVEEIIVSGGLGKEGFEEADVMAAYLARAGIPAAQIHVDRDGYNTRKTARNAKTLSQSVGFDSVVVVTSYFHVVRSQMAFRDAGFNKVQGAHARYVEWRDFYSIIREFPAFYFYLLGGRT